MVFKLDFKKMLADDPDGSKFRAPQEAEAKAEAEKRAKFFQPGKEVIQYRGNGWTQRVKLVEEGAGGWWVTVPTSNSPFFCPDWELDYLPIEEVTF